MSESGNSIWSTACLSEALTPLRDKDKELRRIIVLTQIPPTGTRESSKTVVYPGGGGLPA